MAVHASDRKMILTTFMLPAGYHKDSWRLSGSRVEELPGLEFVAELTTKAEQAKLDAVFFGDMANATAVLEGDIKMTGFYEPITTLSALAARTSKIGLIGTVSTSFESPYTVARQIAGLDHMSNGRAGWNVVTSSDGFDNYGYDSVPDPVDRYRRAKEFVTVARQLWDSWSDDAVIVDRENARYTDNTKIRRIDHRGEFFSVRGPIAGPRSPQGQPIIVQAGSSEPGIDLGSSIADGIYTVHPVKETAVRFYQEMKSRVRQKGRNPDHVKVLPGVVPILGATQREAEELSRELANHVHLEQGRAQLARSLKMDLSSVDLEDAIPEAWFSDDPKMGTRYRIYRMKAVEQGMNLRELIIDAARSTGHRSIVGTPSDVADMMVDWFDSGACDGFNLNSSHNPAGFHQLCDLLVPELQERGYFREDYEGDTLRDHMGLPRPAA